MTKTPAALPTGVDPAPYAALAAIDRAGLMWEYVRRDPDYIAWYARASTATQGDEPRPAPLLWGLHFRRGSPPAGAAGEDPLG